MSERLHQLLEKMNDLENELAEAIEEHQSRMFFQIKGKRIEFDEAIRQKHRKLRSSWLRWLTRYRPRNLLTGPIIYGMIIPLVLVDLCISFYQASCFPIYGISKVRRRDYIVFDRQHLDYLNMFEKFHCSYCAYGAGLIAYCSEIVARTEQYFCPIKHARKVLGTHARYARFIDFGDAAEYEEKLESYRVALGKGT